MFFTLRSVLHVHLLSHSDETLVQQEVTQDSFNRTHRIPTPIPITQDGVCVLVVNCLSFCSSQTMNYARRGGGLGRGTKKEN